MRRISTADIREKEVINLCDGDRLGFTCDFEIDADDGKILALYVDGGGSLPFCKKEEYLIPWCRIECIGEDAILVKIPQGELSGFGQDCKQGKRRLFH